MWDYSFSWTTHFSTTAPSLGESLVCNCNIFKGFVDLCKIKFVRFFLKRQSIKKKTNKYAIIPCNDNANIVLCYNFR